MVIIIGGAMDNSALSSDCTGQKIHCILQKIDANNQEKESKERPNTAGTASIYPNSCVSTTNEISHVKENPFSLFLQGQRGQPICDRKNELAPSFFNASSSTYQSLAPSR
jgi:hypothetical protein